MTRQRLHGHDAPCLQPGLVACTTLNATLGKRLQTIEHAFQKLVGYRGGHARLLRVIERRNDICGKHLAARPRTGEITQKAVVIPMGGHARQHGIPALNIGQRKRLRRGLFQAGVRVLLPPVAHAFKAADERRPHIHRQPTQYCARRVALRVGGRRQRPFHCRTFRQFKQGGLNGRGRPRGQHLLVDDNAVGNDAVRSLETPLHRCTVIRPP